MIELQRSIDAFCIMYNIDNVDELYFCGAGVDIPGVIDHMQHSLGLPSTIFDPFASFSLLPGVEDKFPGQHHTHVVATGLAVV